MLFSYTNFQKNLPTVDTPLPHPPPPPPSLAPLARAWSLRSLAYYRPPKMKSWLRHCVCVCVCVCVFIQNLYITLIIKRLAMQGHNRLDGTIKIRDCMNIGSHSTFLISICHFHNYTSFWIVNILNFCRWEKKRFVHKMYFIYIVAARGLNLMNWSKCGKKKKKKKKIIKIPKFTSKLLGVNCMPKLTYL